MTYLIIFIAGVVAGMIFFILLLNSTSSYTSVTVSLPKHERPVIVVYKSKIRNSFSVSVGVYYLDGYGWHSCIENAEPISDSQITHWMPIPKLPRI